MKAFCLNCGSNYTNDASIFSLKDRRKGIPGKWQYVTCKYCGFISIIPLPSDSQLKNYYSFYSKNKNIKSNRIKKYSIFIKLFHKLSGDVDPHDFISIPQGASILDYGFGEGSYINSFFEMGATISGAEINEENVKNILSNGIDVRLVDDFTKIPFEDERFDIVYLMQVFEHLRDPNVFLGELARITKNGGLIYLALPNELSYWRRIFKLNWVSGWFAPYHLHFYNRNTLSSLAIKHGFYLVDNWSRTPDRWFRTNLKAMLYPKENQLDYRTTLIDTFPVRYIIMFLLRIAEIFIRESDCLVLKFQKRVM